MVPKALFVDREIEVGLELVDLIEIILERDRKPELVGDPCDAAVVPQLILGGEWEAGRVRVPVEIVRLDRIEALSAADAQTRPHQRH